MQPVRDRHDQTGIMRARPLLSARRVNIRPTPLTAALAGLIAAIAWPLVWARFGGPAADGGFELIVATLLVIALPAHAFVVGFSRPHQEVQARTLDTALLKRIGAWLAAAAGTTVLRTVAGL
jgi:uncharacterized YccA/Bax inhibitor family protein